MGMVVGDYMAKVPSFLMQCLMYQWASDDPCEIKVKVFGHTQARLRDRVPITVQPFSLAGTDAAAYLRSAAARIYSADCAANLAA